jgi:hypothetical protein
VIAKLRRRNRCQRRTQCKKWKQHEHLPCYQ